MEIKVVKNGEAASLGPLGLLGLLGLRLEACCHVLSPHLELTLPEGSSFAVGDSLQVMGDGRLLFEGPVQRVQQVEQSRVLVEAYEPLDTELLLNFHKEKWGNILREVYADVDFHVSDFELEHYSLKASLKSHLRQLKSLLEQFSGREYWFYLSEENRLQVVEAGQSRSGAKISGALISHGRGVDSYQAFPLLLGQASGAGIAERLELLLRPSRERLRVWWGKIAGGS